MFSTSLAHSSLAFYLPFIVPKLVLEIISSFGAGVRSGVRGDYSQFCYNIKGNGRPFEYQRGRKIRV
jgi:hypothetical protein